jgi:molybdopterin molybdotransferase
VAVSTPLISIQQAREQVLQAIRPLPSEPVGIDQALGRVLAQDVTAAGDVPPFPCSAMDGYAIHAGPDRQRLRVVGESRAGGPSEHPLAPGEAIRISTGAAVPLGATAVIAQENVTADADAIETHSPTSEGQNIRGVGEDMRQGTAVLAAGDKLGAVELGAATAAGAGSLLVAQQPRVSVLCTGDELRAPGEPLQPGEIHNSNAPMLTGLAVGEGALTSPAERLPDDRAATVNGIQKALERSDVVIISGGVSVGPHDHVKPALSALGVQEIFWSVALQPGKPTWFGSRDGGRYVFGLPGNPVSAVVTYSLFVSPALSALQGARPRRKLEAQATLGTPVRRSPRREQAMRVRLEREGGQTVALPNGAQGSHILTSLVGADALAMIPAGEGTLEAGATVALEELAS